VTGRQLAGVFLLVLGTIALVYRGFSYTTESHDARIGPLEIHVSERERVSVPAWVGATAIAAGAVLLVVGRRRRA
jgi:drug/metabolite transporter (DMT)-like permease